MLGGLMGASPLLAPVRNAIGAGAMADEQVTPGMEAFLGGVDPGVQVGQPTPPQGVMDDPAPQQGGGGMLSLNPETQAMMQSMGMDPMSGAGGAAGPFAQGGGTQFSTTPPSLPTPSFDKPAELQGVHGTDTLQQALKETGTPHLLREYQVARPEGDQFDLQGDFQTQDEKELQNFFLKRARSAGYDTEAGRTWLAQHQRLADVADARRSKAFDQQVDLTRQGYVADLSRRNARDGINAQTMQRTLDRVANIRGQQAQLALQADMERRRRAMEAATARYGIDQQIKLEEDKRLREIEDAAFEYIQDDFPEQRKRVNTAVSTLAGLNDMSLQVFGNEIAGLGEIPPLRAIKSLTSSERQTIRQQLAQLQAQMRQTLGDRQINQAEQEMLSRAIPDPADQPEAFYRFVRNFHKLVRENANADIQSMAYAAQRFQRAGVANLAGVVMSSMQDVAKIDDQTQLYLDMVQDQYNIADPLRPRENTGGATGSWGPPTVGPKMSGDDVRTITTKSRRPARLGTSF